VVLRSLALPALTGLVALSAGCLYDFDEAFSGSPGAGGDGAGTSTGGQGETGGAGAAGSGGAGNGATGGGATGGNATGGTGAIGGGATGGAATGGLGGAGGFAGGCECVPPPPNQWDGPAVRYFGSAFDVLPSCPAPWSGGQDIGFGNIVGAAHTCSNCACGAPSVSCGAATTPCYNVGSCGGLAGTASPPLNGNCEDTGFTMALDGIGNTARGQNVPIVGGCTASGGVVTKPPADWENPGIVCTGGTSVEGCVNPGEVCAFIPPAPYEKKFCITRNGNRTCPADYPDKQLIDSSFNDTRSCTSCNCGSPSGVSCSGGQTTLYSGLSCSGSTDVINNNGTCQSLSFNARSSRLTLVPAPSGVGSCAESGGSTSGSASGGSQETMCCRDGM